MALYTSPFVLLGMENGWTADQTLTSKQSGAPALASPKLTLRGWSGSAPLSNDMYTDSGGDMITELTSSGLWALYFPNASAPNNTLLVAKSGGGGWYFESGGEVVFSGLGGAENASGYSFNGPMSALAGLNVPSGESVTGAGSLNLTGTGEFGGLFTAAGGIETAGGGTAPSTFSPGASGTATAVSTSRNVTLICTAAGTQSADGEINGTSIGAQWSAGMVVPLKANDTVTWTGTAAPTFLYMYA